MQQEIIDIAKEEGWEKAEWCVFRGYPTPNFEQELWGLLEWHADRT
jgi:hypothetical protein